MKNPVEVEQQFNELCHELMTTASHRYKWKRIEAFLADISEDFGRFDTFIVQLISHLPIMNNPLRYSGINPDRIISIIRLLLRCEQSVPKISDQQKYRESRDALVQCACLQLAFVGMFERLIQLCNDVYKTNGGKEITAILERIDSTDNQEILVVLAKKMRAKQNYNLADLLDRLSEMWTSQFQAESHSALIPVVEHHDSLNSYNSGRLRRLTARVTTEEKKKQHDSYTNNFMVVGGEQSDSCNNGQLADAVRARLTKTHPQLQDRFFDLLLSYELHEGWQVGRSSEVGAAGISYCAILDYCGCRETFTISSNLATTGGLNENSSVSAVDPQSIKAKAEAVFFSWVSTLAVPEQQREEFKIALAKLFEQYPQRDKIKIIGIRNLDELFFNRQATNHKILSRTKHYLQKAWKRKFSVAGITLIVVLLLFIVRLLYGPIDKNPVNGVFKGEYLFVENQYGQTLARLDAGYRTDYKAESASSDGSDPQVQFVDTNGDGVNEVIWATNMSRSGKETEYFRCWSVTGDSLLWERPALFDIDFPRKSGMEDNHFFIGELLRVRLPDDQAYIISRLAMREMFPGLVVLLDPSTGTVENKYIHAGQVNGLELVDITGNGISEVVISGINNAFNKAFAGVLDLQNIEGHSPVQGDYKIAGVDQAEELHYLLIPKTKVGQYLDPIERYNRAGEINFAKEDSLISVWVRDGQAHAFEGIQRSFRIIAHFDFKFIPQGFSTSDQYDIVAEELYQEGKIKSIPDYDYFEAFKDSILYWDGEQFKSRAKMK